MDSRERGIQAIYMEEPDVVPWFDNVDPRVLSGIFSKHFTPDIIDRSQQKHFEEYVKATVKLGIDFISCGPIFDPHYNMKLDDKYYVNEWGRIHSFQLLGDISNAYIGGYLDTSEKWDSFNFAPAVNDWRMEVFRITKKLAEKYHLCFLAACGSIVEVGMEAVGIPQFLRSLYRNPDFIKKVIRHSADYTMELGLAFAEEGVDALLIYDDYAYHSGPFIPPALWNKFVLPWNKEVISAFHKAGVPVVLHACGDLRTLMDGIIESGYDAVHPLEPTANMTLKEAKERWGDKICLMGNININTLSIGTTEDVEKEAREAIRCAAPGGGYIYASGHAIYHSCLPENVAVMSQVKKKYGIYKR